MLGFVVGCGVKDRILAILFVLFTNCNSTRDWMGVMIIMPKEVRYPECDSSGVRNSSAGEAVCTNCSLISDEKVIDLRPKWRVFISKEKMKQNGVSVIPNRIDKDLEIDQRIKDEPLESQAYGDLCLFG